MSDSLFTISLHLLTALAMSTFNITPPSIKILSFLVIYGNINGIEVDDTKASAIS